VRIQSLSISSFRNIKQANLSGFADLNIFVGQNGSGKTSILEALYFLAAGKSFRSQRIQNVIQHGSDKCLLVGKDNEGCVLGIEKAFDGTTSIRYRGDTIKTASYLAEIFPIQLINDESFLLLTAGPHVRRQLMDWGVFHVEHTFFSVWSQCQKNLKQRNALLRQYKQQTPLPLLKTWTDQLCESSLLLDGLRDRWFESFVFQIKPILETLLPSLSSSLSFSYYCGWDKKRGLELCLVEGADTDLHRGFTHYGPQRADIRVKVDGRPAEEVLSRGQQKLVVASMKVAQQKILESKGKNSSYVIDDLAAELDKTNAEKLLSLILDGSGTKQVFLTAINESDIPNIPIAEQKSTAMFHVEHGVISAADR
jgi:DNA replication and repair protein RecF